MSSEKTRARLQLALSMCIFGTIGIFRRYIPVSSALLAMVRGAIGALFLLALAPLSGRKIEWRTLKGRLALLALSGAFIGINWILLFEAFRYTSVATATLCYYMAPIFVILVSPIFLKEKLTPFKCVCAGVALIGMVLVSGVLNGGDAASLKGVLLGLGAAAFYAAVITLNMRIHGVGAYEKTFVQLASAAAVLLPYELISGDLSALSLSLLSLVLVAVVGIVHTGVAYVIYFNSMKDLSAQTVALFSYIDPVVAIILSALLLHEPMGVPEILGAVLILGATMASELYRPDAKKA